MQYIQWTYDHMYTYTVHSCLHKQYVLYTILKFDIQQYVVLFKLMMCLDIQSEYTKQLNLVKFNKVVNK